MAKEFTCEITKDHGSFDHTETGCTKVCEVKWGGRTPRGYDIRKFDYEQCRLLKGITVPYEAVTDLVVILTSNGLCDLDKVKAAIKKRESSIINADDFQNMFVSLNESEKKYKRDKYGTLRTNNGKIVIKHKRI